MLREAFFFSTADPGTGRQLIRPSGTCRRASRPLLPFILALHRHSFPPRTPRSRGVAVNTVFREIVATLMGWNRFARTGTLLRWRAGAHHQDDGSEQPAIARSWLLRSWAYIGLVLCDTPAARFDRGRTVRLPVAERVRAPTSTKAGARFEPIARATCTKVFSSSSRREARFASNGPDASPDLLAQLAPVPPSQQRQTSTW